ncbi:hypothetical protein KA005_00475 [bacterium]|nr:hypothetical protein [bacterium]
MKENSAILHKSIVPGLIIRKPSGEGLSLEFILGNDDVDIPDDGNEVAYSLTQGKDGIITLTPEGGSEL